MKIAVIWFWAQWKKHVQFWRYINHNPDIFTRTGRESTDKIDNFLPNRYEIIISAISPISEQTQVIKRILKSNYQGYLIIEKPVTYNFDLLELLRDRPKTIFFIDEIFLPLETKKLQKIDSIEVSAYTQSDFINILQHAIGLLLSQDLVYFNWKDLKLQFNISNFLQYSCISNSIENANFNLEGLTIYGEQVVFNFDSTYKYLLLSIRDDDMHRRVRKNYYNFLKMISHRFPELIQKV